MLEILDNPYVVGAVTLFFVLYGGLAGPTLPSWVKKLFQNPIFQLLLFALIAYRGNHDPFSAAMIAIGFLFIMTAIQREWLKRATHLIRSGSSRALSFVEDGAVGLIKLPGKAIRGAAHMAGADQ